MIALVTGNKLGKQAFGEGGHFGRCQPWMTPTLTLPSLKMTKGGYMHSKLHFLLEENV